jgi:hypothetical protein
VDDSIDRGIRAFASQPGIPSEAQQSRASQRGLDQLVLPVLPQALAPLERRECHHMSLRWKSSFPDLFATLLFPLRWFAFCDCHDEGAIVGSIAFLREGLLDG